MPTWKKIVVSGSDAHLHNITASNNVVVSGSVEILGDITITGDDITMGTNTSGHILVADGTNFNPVASSGDATIAANGAISIGNQKVTNAMLADDAVGADELAASAVVNASVADGAAIAFSKLAALESTTILVGSSGNVATSRAVSGDATLSNTGVLTLASSLTSVGSILKTDLVLGEDSQTKIDFETANEIHFDANNAQVMNISDRSVNVDGGAITSSGDISSSADLFGTNLFGADGVFHDNDANTGIVFTSDTITIKENNVQSAKFATTAGNSIGHANSRTALTGSQVLLNSADILAQGAITASGVISSSAADSGFIGDLVGTASFVSSLAGAGLDDGKIFVGNGSDQAAQVTPSGDLTMNNAGAFTIANNAVETAMIADEQVTLAKLAHAAANTVLVRDANSAGDPSFKEVTNTQILIGDGTGFTAAALSGDATMANDGAVTLAAAQTNINSILATDLVLGEDGETKIDFETANEIHFYANNVEQVYVGDNIFGPQSDSDVDLGSNGVRWKDAFVDSLTVTTDITARNAVFAGNLTVQGDLTSVQASTLNVEDKMIVLASGSTSEADSGLILQTHTNSGHGFGFDASVGRWVVESGSLINATSFGASAAAEYMAIVSASAADPSAAPRYGGTSTGHGNFAVNTSDGTVWVYV